MSDTHPFDRRRPNEQDIAIQASTSPTGRICGTPDHVGKQVLAFGAPSNRFDHGNLTYSIDTTGANLNGDTPVPADVAGAVTAIMDSVMATWQRAVPEFFRFTRVSTGSNADIHVQFGGSELNSHFGAVTDNWDGVGSFPGNIAIRSTRSWQTKTLHDTLLHEVGHGLGLQHSTLASSTMNHFLPDLLELSPLDPETLRAIKTLYGWSAPVQLGDRASTEGPALATTNTASFASSTYTLHAVWRGRDNDTGLWSSFSSDGRIWSPQESLAFAASEHAPALCAYDNDSLALLYRGAGDDQDLHFSINPHGAGWQSVHQISGASAARPAIAAFGDKSQSLVAVWRGAGEDQGLWWSRFDGLVWSPQQAIPGVASSSGPALVKYADSLYMFWKGIGSDTSVWFASLASGAQHWSAQQQVTYPVIDGSGNVTGQAPIGTSDAPAACAWFNELMLFWKGIPGDQLIWCAPFRMDGWSGQISVAKAVTASGPGAALLNGQIVVGWRGALSDQTLWFATLSDQGTHFLLVPGDPTKDPLLTR